MPRLYICTIWKIFSFQVDLPGKERPSVTASPLRAPWLEQGLVAVVRLARPVRTVDNVRVGEVKDGVRVTVSGRDGVRRSCQVNSTTGGSHHLTCVSSRSCQVNNNLTCPADLTPGQPVYSRSGQLLALSVGEEGRVEPVLPHLDRIGAAVAADLAERYRAGDRQVLRCKRSEKMAIRFIMVRRKMCQIVMIVINILIVTIWHILSTPDNLSSPAIWLVMRRCRLTRTPPLLPTMSSRLLSSS